MNSIVGSGSGSSLIPNTTIPAIPFLSASATFSDSPLFRFDANTIEQRNGVNAQTLRIFNSWTDAADNHGLHFICTGALCTIETFKNGVDAVPNIVINSGNNRIDMQIAGSSKLQLSSTGIVPQSPIIQYSCNSNPGQTSSTAAAGAPWICASQDVTNVTAATQTETVLVVGSSSSGAGGAGKYRINLQYQVNVIQSGATLNFSISWVDSHSVTHTRTGSLSLAAAGETSLIFIINAKNSQTVSVTTTITSGGTASYDGSFYAEQLE